MKLRYAFLGLVGLLVGAVFYAGPAAAVLYYHQHVFPLGRLASSIQVGDAYADVRAKMAAYEHDFGAQRPVILNEFESDTTLLSRAEIPRAKGLHLYDVSVFGDVELSVLFDPGGRVLETRFSAG